MKKPIKTPDPLITIILNIAMAILMLLPTTASSQEDHQYIAYPDWPYFSEMVIAGNTIYLSGMIGISEDDLLIVPGGIEPETRQAMKNIQTALAKVDATMDDVVKCTVFLADMSDWVSMNQVYISFFSKDRVPARSAVAVNSLSGHGKVEVECIAVMTKPEESK